MKNSITILLLLILASPVLADDYDSIISGARTGTSDLDKVMLDAGEALHAGSMDKETSAFESNINNQDNSKYDVLKESLELERGREQLRDTYSFFNKSQEGLVRQSMSEDDPVLAGEKSASSSVQNDKLIVKGSIRGATEKLEISTAFGCESSIPQVEKSCTVRRVVTVKEQPDTYENISIHVAGTAYASSTFYINLLTGSISGANSLASISSVIGARSDKVTSGPTLISSALSSSYFTESVTHSLLQHPTKANGYVAIINVTGHDLETCSWRKSRKRACENRRNRARGVQYTWQVSFKSPPVFESSFVDDCGDLEKDVSDGGCYQDSITDNEVNVTKEVSGYTASMPFWSQIKKYVCGGGDGSTTCNSIPTNCTFSNSECLERKGRYCVKEKKNYRFGSEVVIDGEVNDVSGELNFKTSTASTEHFGAEELAEAATAMQMVNELPSHFTGDDLDNPTLFKGEQQSCNIVAGSGIQNCCAFKGLLKGVIGGGCPSEVTSILAPAVVRDNRCHMTQDITCTKRVLKKCVRWTKKYCCYQNKLARIIQEIAHQQLSIPWEGCAPVTPDIIEKLDFDAPYAKSRLQELVGENLAKMPGVKTNMSEKLAAKFEELKGKKYD